MPRKGSQAEPSFRPVKTWVFSIDISYSSSVVEYPVLIN